MPSGWTTVTAATFASRCCDRADSVDGLAVAGNRMSSQQSYQLVRSPLDRVVDHDHVELGLRGDFVVGVLQPAPDRLGVLGAAADQPALELIDAGRR